MARLVPLPALQSELWLVEPPHPVDDLAAAAPAESLGGLSEVL